MNTFRAIIRSMRPRQWTKNILFVYPAILFDAKLLELDLLLRVTTAAALLVLLSGSVYIINDLLDRDHDRIHPSKRHRPIASGELPIGIAQLAAAALALVSLGLAYRWDFELFILLGIYLLIQLVYSFRLKRVALLDVLIVAAGFVIRVMIGGVVIDVEVSPWLYSFTGLLALFLVVGKRRQELIMLGAQAEDTRPTFRQYNLPLLDDMLRIVTTSTLITYILYTIEVETMTKHGANWGLITVPFVLYGLLRYLYLLHVEESISAPEEILLSDRPIQFSVLLSAIAYFIILYVF